MFAVVGVQKIQMHDRQFLDRDSSIRSSICATHARVRWNVCLENVGARWPIMSSSGVLLVWAWYWHMHMHRAPRAQEACDGSRAPDREDFTRTIVSIQKFKSPLPPAAMHARCRCAEQTRPDLVSLPPICIDRHSDLQRDWNRMNVKS